MIIRIVRAKVQAGKLGEFKKLMEEQSIPYLKEQDGLLACYPGEPLEGDAEFVMVTHWRDLDALKKFVGENWQKPLVGQDEAALVEALVAYHYVNFNVEGS